MRARLLAALLGLTAAALFVLIGATQAAQPQAPATVPLSPPAAVWPTTVAGWVALAAGGIALLAALYTHAKNLANLNGMGRRLEKIEEAEERRTQQAADLVRMVERCTDAQVSLAERVAEAKKAADSCDDRARDHSIEIGAKIDDLRKEVRTLADRLLVMETKAENPPPRQSGAQPRAD